jgi:para-nitrobenzyl esterase
MAGWNRDEGGLPPATLASYRTIAEQTWGSSAEAFLKVYPATNDAEAARSYADFNADRFIADSTWEWIEAQIKTGGAPVYRYYFERPSPGDRYHPVTAGVFHSSEIEYVFGNLRVRPSAPFTAADLKLSEMMQSYWVNFAKSGNPNGPALPEWPAYNADRRGEVMHLDATPMAEPDTTRERYLFLQTATPVTRAN